MEEIYVLLGLACCVVVAAFAAPFIIHYLQVRRKDR